MNGDRLKKSTRHVLLENKWLFVWIFAALLFFIGIWVIQGKNPAIDFAAGYIIELSLSVDNLFVFLFIFTSFHIDEKAQHRVLTYGIAGTIILRFLFIFIGVSLVNRFEWVLYIFGGLLIFSGIRMALEKEEEGEDPHNSRMFRFFQKILPMTRYFADDRFFVENTPENRGGKDSAMYRKVPCLATPLLAVLLLIVFSDIIFAIDSVPAVISITRDLFIVCTSNLFAVLGLRQFFFVLEHMHRKFQYVKYAVSLILIFTGIKMIIEIFGLHVDNLLSIGIICGLLGGGILVSVILSSRQDEEEEKQEQRQENAAREDEI